MCLLGCVIFVLDYQRTIPATELAHWTKLMLTKGAEVESTYSMRVTHVLCETTRSPLAQQAMRDGKRLVTAFWFNDVILRQQMFLPTQVLFLFILTMGVIHGVRLDIQCFVTPTFYIN